MCASQSSPQQYFGDLVVKVGYRTQAEGIVSIYVNGKKPVFTGRLSVFVNFVTFLMTFTLLSFIRSFIFV